jgi:hypothetical protein
MIFPEFGTSIITRAFKGFIIICVIRTMAAEKPDFKNIEHDQEISNISDKNPPISGEQAY